MIKETRKLYFMDVRTICIHNNFYTCGTCEEYDSMLNRVKEVDNVTTNFLQEIAEDILKHSHTEELAIECADNGTTLTCRVMSLLAQRCFSIFE